MTSQIILQLISLYCYVSDEYNNTLFVEVQRFSPNSCPKFSDEEVMASYLWGLSQGNHTVKAVYNFIRNYYFEYFPKMPSYQEYNRRVNMLESAFRKLTDQMLIKADTTLEMLHDSSVVDSFPVVVAKGKRIRSAKVAKGLCSAGYCSSKDMHYYGIKIHVLSFRREKALPVPEAIQLTPAACHDLTAVRSVFEKLDHRSIFADMAYIDSGLSQTLAEKDTYLLTPVKKRKGQTEWETQFFKAGNDLYSTAVSRVRQPIESFFNWLNEHWDIQRASKVRSLSGLLVFVFARLILALWRFLSFNS